MKKKGPSATKTCEAAVTTAEQQLVTEESNQIPSLSTPFCEANLNFVQNELLYVLHPRMPIGDTIYIENAP